MARAKMQPSERVTLRVGVTTVAGLVPVTLLAAALCCAATFAGPPTAILLDDFEDGVGDWRTNDSTVADAGEVPKLCGIYASPEVPPGGGLQGAMIDFLPAKNAWASVSLPVNGQQWRENQVGQLSLWIKPETNRVSVIVTLRARVPVESGKTEDRSYVQEIKPPLNEWQHIALRFFGFRTKDGTPLDDDSLSHVYLLQFVETGAWARTRLYVDEIEVRPLVYADQQAPSQPRPDETVVIDFRQDIGRCLAQIGFNLAAGALNRQASDEVAAQLSARTADLTPCVGRLRLGQYYDIGTHRFNVAGLNQDVNWLLAKGVKPLICLDMPAELPETEDMADVGAEFETMCTRLVELRRGTDISPYYELFDEPMARRFDEVNELVAEYNRLSAALQRADPTARIGGPGLAQPDQWLVKEFLGGAVKPYFLSTYLRLPGPRWSDDPHLADAALRGALSAQDEWGYEQTARCMDQVRPRPELFVTDWGIRRAPSVSSAAAGDEEAADAVFLATSALSAMRYVDKLLWTQLVGPASALLDANGEPRSAYWAAWLVNTYAPRGATCRARIPYSADTLIAAVTTQHAANVFIINRSPSPTTMTFEAVGVSVPETVRERKLDLAEAHTVQHRNLSLSTTQKVRFQGAGVSVIQFINRSAGPIAR